VFYEMALQAGDVGVRSIQSFALSASWTSGSFSLVAFRILAEIDFDGSGYRGFDAIQMGFPRCFDNTVPFLLWQPGSTTATTIAGSTTYAHG
jgi:hypothetical protein